jgi:uncharacterized membrane protein YphA (DoxX/SURF4 family)
MTTIETRSPQADATRAAAYQAFWLLRVGFTVAPILFGIDKFFNWTVHWPDYLAGWINDIVPGSAQSFMYFVGGVEITAGLIVAVAPVIGGPLVAAWLAGIVINLLTNNPPEYYDIALRDFGLMLAALTLTRLAWAFARTTAEPSAERASERRLRLGRAA